MFLVDRNYLPAQVSLEVLEDCQDPSLTTEIARFNLEANLSPRRLTGRCFHDMENELKSVLERARRSANKFDAEVLLAGILPTLRKSDLRLENITPIARYYQLDKSIAKLRGGPFSIHIKGLDELQLTHDNIMMESCNTSFQVHLQVSPGDFARLHNVAQGITAPLVAAAANSPLLFGHRLWQETRLALFQHSTDARSATQQARSQPTRVGFGERWLEKSVLEMFRDQIARFRVIMTSRPDENPFSVLARNEIPLLNALRLHNGTIWPWNRACYGISDGRPHLRIENRALPSGPTIVDEIANAAFFIGLMTAVPEEYGDITRLMTFDQAKENFFVAARHGLNAQLSWVQGQAIAAPDLILNQLLPLARSGLKQENVASEDIDLYLGTIEERVHSRQTGAQWLLSSFAAAGDKPRDFRCRLLAEQILSNQQENIPVHKWPIPQPRPKSEWSKCYQRVGQFMSTDLFTMRPDDLVDLAASLMEWVHIRHVPVEDEKGQLVGLISHRALLRLFTRTSSSDRAPVTVREIMLADPITVCSTTPTLEAIEIMRSKKIGCLPVVDDGHLVGIVTSYDFLEASATLFQRELESIEQKPAAQPKEMHATA
jgi:CBS domain-containing protein/gamma-glutamylcysteine synthetase